MLSDKNAPKLSFRCRSYKRGFLERAHQQKLFLTWQLGSVS